MTKETELEALEQAMVESPVDFAENYFQRMHAELLDMDGRQDEREDYERKSERYIGHEGIVIIDPLPGNFAREANCSPDEEEVSIDGKTFKPDLAVLAKTRVTILGDGVGLRKVRIDTARTWLCDKVRLHATYGKKLIWCDAVPEISEPDSSDFVSGGQLYRTRTHTDYGKPLIWCSTESSSLADPSNYRAIGACYDSEYPQKENPDSRIFRRKPRNASPTRKKDAGLLNAFRHYFELNKSFEPLQSNYGKADNDNFTEQDWVEGDAKKPERDVEAEREIRPSVNELVQRYDVPTVKFETRVVRCRMGGPAFRGFKPCDDESFTREMKIPVSGDVQCMVTYTDTVVTREKRSVEVERQKLVMIDDLKKGDRWSIYRIGDLRFAPCETKHHYRGQLTHYRDNGRWFRPKDAYGTPKGPKERSDPKYWVSLHPLIRSTKMVWLSPEEKREQRANKDKSIMCLTLYHRRKKANSDIRYEDLPSYDVPLEKSIGTAYITKEPEPTTDDDVVERRSELAAFNARLSPQELSPNFGDGRAGQAAAVVG
jgi:hypothetical protein